MVHRLHTILCRDHHYLFVEYVQSFDDCTVTTFHSIQIDVWRRCFTVTENNDKSTVLFGEFQRWWWVKQQAHWRQTAIGLDSQSLRVYCVQWNYGEMKIFLEIDDIPISLPICRAIAISIYDANNSQFEFYLNSHSVMFMCIASANVRKQRQNQ